MNYEKKLRTQVGFYYCCEKLVSTHKFCGNRRLIARN